MNEWRENLKESHPNGVLCWVWDYLYCDAVQRVVKDYDKEKGFITSERAWKNAIPVMPSEAPDILNFKLIIGMIDL